MYFHSYEELGKFLAFWLGVEFNTFWSIRDNEEKISFCGNRKQIEDVENFFKSTHIQMLPVKMNAIEWKGTLHDRK